MKLGYATGLVIGFSRAVFWSGGWYWRLPILVGALPEVRAEVQPVLNWLGLDHISSTWFYVFAGGFATLILGARLAYLETRRVVPLRINIFLDSDNSYFRVEVKNISFIRLDRIMCRLVELHNGLEQNDIEDNIDLPLVLLTQERWRRSGIEGNPPTRGRWNLDPGETKNIEVFRTNVLEDSLDIRHESGIIKRSLSDINIKLQISGAGSMVTFKIYFFGQGYKQMAYLVRDSADETVLSHFTRNELLGSENGAR